MLRGLEKKNLKDQSNKLFTQPEIKNKVLEDKKKNTVGTFGGPVKISSFL